MPACLLLLRCFLGALCGFLLLLTVSLATGGGIGAGKEIIALEGFGEKSYENLIASINESRNTTFVRFLVAMDIPLIGRTASRILDRHFHSSLRKLRLAALDRFDFTCLEGIGDIISSSLHKWFRNPHHLLLWGSLQNELHFENGLDA